MQLDPSQMMMQQQMQMYQQSLAGQFNVKNIVGKSFNGSKGGVTWVQWNLLWKKADAIMGSMGFTEASRFWELKKVVEGEALQYIKMLPEGDNQSYEKAMGILIEMYADYENPIRNLSKMLLNLKPSDGSQKDRVDIHSKMISYREGLVGQRCSAEDALLSLELAIIETKLDIFWKKDYLKLCERKKDPNAPLGMHISYFEVQQKLHQSMVQAAKMKGTPGAPEKPDKAESKGNKSKRGGSDKPQQFLSYPAQMQLEREPMLSQQQAFANATVAGAPKRQNRGAEPRPARASTVIIPCPFCIGKNGKQEYLHAYPTKCPLFQKGSPKMLTVAEMRKRLDRQRACFNCFGQHQTAKCDAPPAFYCREEGCGKRHHTIFHDQMKTK